MEADQEESDPMDLARLRRCRSLLFLPAANPRAIEKARTLTADMVILDLEDAVKEEDKAAAREAVIAATREGFGERLVAVRINAADSPHFGEDVVALRQASPDFIVLAKADDAKQAQTRSGDGARCGDDRNRRAVAEVDSIARQRGCRRTTAFPPILSCALPGARALLCAATDRAAARAPVSLPSRVYNRPRRTRKWPQCAPAAPTVDGKSAIHPSQIAPINAAFSPGAAEIEAAERLIAAATGGAERHEGRMIEAMHVEEARAVLAKAGRI